MRHGLVGSCGGLHEIAHPHQVVHGCGEGEEPADPPDPTKFDLPQQPHRLQPAEDFFNSFPFLLTGGIAEVSYGPAVNGTCPPRRVLGDMGCHLSDPQRIHERRSVIVLISTQRDPSCEGPCVDQGQRRLPFCGPRRRGDRGVDDQAVPVLYQDMAQEAQLRLLARGLLVQPSLGIRRRGMRGIRPPLASKVHAGIARVIRRRHGRGVGFLLEALLPRPGCDQRAIDREVLVGQEALGLGLRQHLLEECRGHLSPPTSGPDSS